jgi:hypothetical protein
VIAYVHEEELVGLHDCVQQLARCLAALFLLRAQVEMMEPPVVQECVVVRGLFAQRFMQVAIQIASSLSVRHDTLDRRSNLGRQASSRELA